MQRAIDLRGAVAINVITMIGIGPLVTIPLVIAALGGPLALVGWIAGAVVASATGWCGPNSRRDIQARAARTSICVRSSAHNARTRVGISFQLAVLLYAPCLLASGYIGFANYAAYLIPLAATTRWSTTPSRWASAC